MPNIRAHCIITKRASGNLTWHSALQGADQSKHLCHLLLTCSARARGTLLKASRLPSADENMKVNSWLLVRSEHVCCCHDLAGICLFVAISAQTWAWIFNIMQAPYCGPSSFLDCFYKFSKCNKAKSMKSIRKAVPTLNARHKFSLWHSKKKQSVCVC